MITKITTVIFLPSSEKEQVVDLIIDRDFRTKLLIINIFYSSKVLVISVKERNHYADIVINICEIVF